MIQFLSSTVFLLATWLFELFLLAHMYTHMYTLYIKSFAAKPDCQQKKSQAFI